MCSVFRYDNFLSQYLSLPRQGRIQDFLKGVAGALGLQSQ